jgi:hypothetical protein
VAARKFNLVNETIISMMGEEGVIAELIMNVLSNVQEPISDVAKSAIE